MAVSGLPEPCESHARCIARLALDIMDLSKRVKNADLDGIVIISYYYGSFDSFPFPFPFVSHYFFLQAII